VSRPGSPQDPWASYNSDPRAFWEQVWKEILGREIDVPTIRKLKGKTKKAIEKYKFMLVFLPKITENDYPEGFVKPAWGRYLDVSQIERRSLPGRWVLVETIAKSNWNDSVGHKDDLFGQDLGLTSRFKISWNHLTASILPKATKLLGLARPAVRQPTLEEWNLIGNLFNWLCQNRGMSLPDLGSTNFWERCFNTCGSDNYLVAGGCVKGGLSGVHKDPSGCGSVNVAFRVLAVL
jgi:hypothetical protein